MTIVDLSFKKIRGHSEENCLEESKIRVRETSWAIVIVRRRNGKDFFLQW